MCRIDTVSQTGKTDKRFLRQSESIFIGKHFPTLRFDLRFCQLTALHGIQYSFHLFLYPPGNEQQVVPRLQCLQANTRVIGRYSLHGKCIRKHQPFELHLLCQQIMHHFARKRGRYSSFRLKHRHFQMSHHHTGQSGLNRFSERIKLHAVQTCTRKRQLRQ